MPDKCNLNMLDSILNDKRFNLEIELCYIIADKRGIILTVVKGEINMKNVLIDNWSLEEIVFNLNNPQQLLKCKAFCDVLEAIVLWDNIYFPNNEHAGFWQYLSCESDMKKYLVGYKDNNEFYNTSNRLYEKYYKDKYTKNLACGAIRYSLFAENLGFDYLPCEKRSQFIQKGKMHSMMCNEKNLYINGRINNGFSRSDFCTPVNNEVKSFYNEFNTYYEKETFEFKLPILANYIINSKPASLTYFEYAKELKNTLSVKLFLNYINDVEKKLSQGNFIPCYRFKNDVRDLVYDICKKDPELIVVIDASLIPKPVMNYDIFKIRKINYSFLKKIIKYSIYPDR